MSLILSRYECADCPRRHANGSKAQARCVAQRVAVQSSHYRENGKRYCQTCFMSPAWSQHRCQSCCTSPRERGLWAKRHPEPVATEEKGAP